MVSCEASKDASDGRQRSPTGVAAAFSATVRLVEGVTGPVAGAPITSAEANGVDGWVAGEEAASVGAIADPLDGAVLAGGGHDGVADRQDVHRHLAAIGLDQGAGAVAGRGVDRDLRGRRVGGGGGRVEILARIVAGQRLRVAFGAFGNGQHVSRVIEAGHPARADGEILQDDRAALLQLGAGCLATGLQR